MTHSHAVVWMDSKEAHVFRFNAEDVEHQRIKAHSPFRKVHHKAGVVGAGHQQLDRDYFDHIVDALRGVNEWLLVGPGGAKDQLVHHVDAHVAGVDRNRVWLSGREARVELVVDEQAPDVAIRHPPYEVLDVDAAVAQRAAVTIGLGDLGLECDDTLEAGHEIAHGPIQPHGRRTGLRGGGGSVPDRAGSSAESAVPAGPGRDGIGP